MPIIGGAISESGIAKADIGFYCHGSSDYIAGQAFSFVGALDALGAWPPICESHVEMDGAWALWEAWVRLQEGDVDTALVYSSAKPAAIDLEHDEVFASTNNELSDPDFAGTGHRLPHDLERLFGHGTFGRDVVRRAAHPFQEAN